jgi:serine O-acetyltransferase
MEEMIEMQSKTNELQSISEKIVTTYQKIGGINRIDGENLPSPGRVIEILNSFLTVIFPGFFGKRVPARSNILFFVQSAVDSLYVRCVEEFDRALKFQCKMDKCKTHDCLRMAEEAAMNVILSIPRLREKLKMDVQAGYEGDPAAKSTDEVILCYPFIYAIATHRVAHEIASQNIPLIPRIMSEWAHHRTGIDIHPGATIGDRFFIDHGTGVVVGETTEIGNDVKIYQGVTLGALSFPKQPDGSIVKGGKRHPTIENNVTIYANATILGGETVIGKGAVIGANAWVTKPIPPNTRVSIKMQQ